MSNDSIILILILIGVITAVFLLFKQRNNQDELKEDKEAEEIANLKSEISSLKDTLNTTINSSLGAMSTSFNNLSTGVTRDMTNTLAKVDEKVSAFNSQVESLNESQKGINQILAGVKTYGTLAEFSLGSLIKDLLPSSQYFTNVKMKSENFLLKLGPKTPPKAKIRTVVVQYLGPLER